MSSKRSVTVIVGPTASGKSSVALKLAEKHESIIINSDSLQVYEDVPILTAQPSASDKLHFEHKLYGYIPFYDKINIVKWAKETSQIILEAFDKNIAPILVGGTGMYIKCLMDGISDLPEISESIRSQAITLAKSNYQELCEIVYNNDCKLKDLITPDKNRQMIRAYEILLQTRNSIRYFFEKPKTKFLEDVDFSFFKPKFDRSLLYEKINTRFSQMIENRAIEEVSSLLAKTNGETNYAAFQAIGVTEIANYLNDKITIDEVINLASARSRQYAKRQITWLNNQFKNIDISEIY